MPYLFLLLSLLCSVTIAMILKSSGRRQEDSLTVIAANYPVALALGFLFSRNLKMGLDVLVMAVVMGFLFLVSFIIYGKAIAREGMASSVTMGRMSLAIPVALSILIWAEMPRLHHWPALIMIMVIIFLWEGGGKRISWLLLSLFTINGLTDTGMKLFKSRWSGVDDSAFLLALFASAGLWAWGWLLWRGQKLSWASVRTGFLLGIPNYGSSYFLLLALNALPGYLVFPFVNVGAVLLAYLAGHALYREALGKRKLVLVILGALAVLLLTL
jgi:drug/metabolite transporter (DMT)-like permease